MQDRRVAYQFQKNSKFAFLAANNVYTDLPTSAFQLSDGTWIMPGLSVPDLGIWEEWLGSIRLESLGRANLVLLVEEPSDHPEVLDEVHHRLSLNLDHLFLMLHLRVGFAISEDDSSDLLCGSSVNGVPKIRQVRQMPRFYRSHRRAGAPLTRAWLEDSLALRAGTAAMEADNTQFRRVVRGLQTLFKGLREEIGQDRLHQFVRSLEALIIPEIGNTKKQFAHRCQTFARAGEDTRALLREIFDMRSAAEHLNPWDGDVKKNHPPDQLEGLYWQRTRQIEHLACDAYSRLLRDPDLREHFRTEDTITAFWKLEDQRRCGHWGTPLDIAQEPLL